MFPFRDLRIEHQRLFLYVSGIQGRHKGANTNLNRTQIINVVDFQLSIKFAAILQDGTNLVSGNSVSAATKAHQLDKLHIRLSTYISGSIVHTGLESPLIQDLSTFIALQMADSILADKDKTLSSDQIIDTVVDFRDRKSVV